MHPILLLILLAIIGGPVLVSLFLAGFGLLYTLMFLLAVIVAACWLVFTVAEDKGKKVILERKATRNPKSFFVVEPGIGRNSSDYLVEVNGTINRYQTLSEARRARDAKLP